VGKGMACREFVDEGKFGKVGEKSRMDRRDFIFSERSCRMGSWCVTM
jgi:hypothetical protein